MRTLISLLAVLVLSCVAFGADVATGVAQLNAAADARIAAIGTPAATKAEASEAKNLQKTRTKLANYVGTNTVAQYRIVAGGVKFVLQSRTEDAAVLAALSEIVNGFVESVDRRRELIDDAKSQLIDPKHVAAVDAAEAALDDEVRKGKAAVASNPAKASALLITAYDLLGRVVAKARKLVEAEQGSPPPIGLSVTSSPSAVEIVNAGPAFYDVQKIRVFAAVTSGATTVKTYTGENAKDVVPGLFAVKGSNRILPATTFDLIPILQGLVPPGTSPARINGLLNVAMKGEPFFVVVFDVTFP